MIERHRQTVQNFNPWVTPAPLSSALYDEFVEVIFFSEPDSGYDTEIFDEELSDTLFGNHGEEEDADEGFDRADNIYEDYSLITSLSGDFVSRVVHSLDPVSKQLNLLSYQRFNSLPCQNYEFSPPTETKQIDGYFLSETYYGIHGVDHPGFNQLFLVTYSLPLLYQVISIPKLQLKKLTPTRSSEKDQLKLDKELQAEEKKIPLINQVHSLVHPNRQSRLFRTRVVEPSSQSFNGDWPVRNTWLTNHIYENHNYELWDDLPSQIQDFTYEIGLTVVDYPDADIVWILDDEDTIDVGTSVSYNLGYRWAGSQLYLESFLRPVEFAGSILDPVWCYESGFSSERELYPEDLNYPILIDFENHILEYLTKDFTTSF